MHLFDRWFAYELMRYPSGEWRWLPVWYYGNDPRTRTRGRCVRIPLYDGV